ncbi:extracellular solute-binding protein [Magnetospirillum sp. 64-120]|uniref:extracellular solute-binding protein n=1 Tax=Magnetospirillum sp. 64-120 TaxID=1895778 RepID=UPI00092C6ABE|nr:extracellular solute-binding protein [Magnetospirillum sp. 64-120]OJX78592.1 MAG: hypothetical protein BGO92_01745 [Magnetospirillum sp. 64-120]
MRHIPVLVGVFLLFGGFPTFAADLVLSGSTTVQSRILQPLAADIKAATGLDVVVEGIGSGNGLKRLAAGEVPAAIVSSPLEGILTPLGLPTDGTYQLHVLAEDEIVPIVNAGNTVSELSWPQLRDLYSGVIRNWKDVGGPDRKVQVVTSHPESATREVVWDLVMGKKIDYARSAKIVYATRKEMVLVAEDAGAIGAVSAGFVQAYADEAKRDGDAIEIKVVRSDKIARPLAIVTKGAPSPEVTRLIDFLRSDAARGKFK